MIRSHFTLETLAFLTLCILTGCNHLGLQTSVQVSNTLPPVRAFLVHAERENEHYPIDEVAPAEVERARGAARRDPAVLKPIVDWLLVHHDDDRAQAILTRVGVKPGFGPYLVSSETPLSDAGMEGARVLVLDLSLFDGQLAAQAIDILDARGRQFTFAEV